jgi:hypothetical protein
MKYLLLQYANESALLNLPKEEASRMHAAYMAYTEAMKKAGVLVANHGLKPTSTATTSASARRQAKRRGRAVRRNQGATRWLLPHRGARSRWRAVLGGALPGRAARLDRDACRLGIAETASNS